MNSFATLDTPLHCLIKGGEKLRRLVWNEAAILSFEEMKKALVTDLFLQVPNFESFA